MTFFPLTNMKYQLHLAIELLAELNEFSDEYEHALNGWQLDDGREVHPLFSPSLGAQFQAFMSRVHDSADEFLFAMGPQIDTDEDREVHELLSGQHFFGGAAREAEQPLKDAMPSITMTQ